MPTWAIWGPFCGPQWGTPSQVTFLNRIERALTIHPHGVFYNKSNEGAFYNDGTSGLSLCQPSYFVMIMSSVVWIYHSHHSGGPGHCHRAVWRHDRLGAGEARVSARALWVDRERSGPDFTETSFCNVDLLLAPLCA